jgi:hypothetical protein
MSRAPPLGTTQLTQSPFSERAISAADSRPCMCDPEITRNGPLSRPLSSRCSLMESIPLMTSAGGCTCQTPAFLVHGPNPLSSLRSRTAIVRSWCQATFQFELGVLLKKIPLTAKHCGPRTLSMTSRTGFEDENSWILGIDKMFLSGYRLSSNSLQRNSTVHPSKHAGTTAKPFRCTSGCNAPTVVTPG